MGFRYYMAVIACPLLHHHGSGKNPRTGVFGYTNPARW
jgi:hypothetical protein